MAEGRIRGYEPRDRPAVRRICFDTGYMGDPVAWQWSDPESFADLFASWYTDHEPGSASVVEIDGSVAGYLLGCRDSTRVATPGTLVARHLLRRGLLARPGTAPVLWRAVADLGRAAVHRDLPASGFHDRRWPAHLHIDLLPRARGQGFGRQLIERWLDTLRADGVAGCHLGTWAENTGALAFFRSVGFEPRGRPVPMPGLRARDGSRHHTQLMVRSLP
ncbi:MAG TPA: GNAT family N-acetyltransferase [Acidimicrobiales bacterium]|nr:GNAT family N-acetyltransferase [Acidimicrobiales bacterium]